MKAPVLLPSSSMMIKILNSIAGATNANQGQTKLPLAWFTTMLVDTSPTSSHTKRVIPRSFYKKT